METIDTAQIVRSGLEMTLTLLIAYSLYLIKVKRSSTDIKDWFKANMTAFGLSFAASWLIAAGIAISPSLSTLLGSLGFNASQSAAAMALVIAGWVIGATSEPTA